jgi:hypothetical protein
MTDALVPETITFRHDMTFRLSCRAGDFILWLRHRNVFSGSDNIQCRDFWEMRDGGHLLVTNRLEDLPQWFRLYPTEVCDSLVYKMMKKVESGDYPSEPIDGPNLWRLRSGDRIAWVGADRPEQRSMNGVLSIVEFRACGLVVGSADWESVEQFAGFGAPTSAEMKPDDVVRCQAAVEAVKKLGLPREWDTKWVLG